MKPSVQYGNTWVTLQTAMNVGYRMTINDLYTASFELPVFDDFNSYCKARTLVDIYDGDRYIGRFRIKGFSGAINGEEATYTYECEHVLAYLADSRIISEADENIFDGKTVGAVVTKILAWQGKGKNSPSYWWSMGTCEHTYEFEEADEYDIKDADILSSVFDVTKDIEGFYWQYDTNHTGTQADPYVMNFLQFPKTATASVTYGRNEVDISRAMDTEEMCTRLFVVGGSGDETVYMKKANTDSGCTGEGTDYYGTGESPDVNGYRIDGKYIISDNAEAEYGVIVKTLKKDKISNGKTLRRAAEYYLMACDHPQYTYTCEMIDLYRYEGTNAIEIGTCVSVTDLRMGIDIITHVTEIEKDDVEGDPLTMKVALSTRTIYDSGLLRFANALLRRM